MKVLVTGADGMLGADLGGVLRRHGHDVHPAGRAALDVTDLAAVRRRVETQAPDLVFHCAAHTRLDEGERDPDLSYRVNTVGTWNVALACQEAGATLVYVSSCGVFDGTKAAPYTELDAPNPVTHHHRSKYEAEKLVAALAPRHFVLRPGWLFGGAADHRRNFVAQRYREAAGAAEVRSADDRFGSPTYTVDFAEAALRLVETRAYGLYHVANAGVASRCDYVTGCVRALGLGTRVVPVGSDHFPRSSPVPAWEALDNYYLRLRGLPALRPWQEALQEYVTERLLPELPRA